MKGTGADTKLGFDKGRFLLKVFLHSNLSILAFIFKTLYSNNEEHYFFIAFLSDYLNTQILSSGSFTNFLETSLLQMLQKNPIGCSLIDGNLKNKI